MTNNQGRAWLCRCAYTSPYLSHEPNTLARCHEASFRNGTKRKIVSFIRDHIDPGIRSIEMVDQESFAVEHDDFEIAPDLGVFGEGVRRIFEIGLLFADVKDGILLIDEFENAIHTSLLKDFTRFVQMLAEEMNVQVFLTTHSKEAVDAFVTNGYKTEDIAAYVLMREKGKTKSHRYGGEHLLQLHEAVDFDLRGI